ncbi:NAD(P)/FAD-dependent oxidoreductase [Stenotrophomonas sp. HITSZ_GD]|uniref:FAD-dependent oxidoreductase n=1 Tax=Stenotrophomonas sp. HITSZ_GD TaxID=3037248 RepID=UPI00240D452B|nr:NAD(P)/FAD-dependent oxidoreductase [Stenotrophomonas sp. HITSZ_GD]MDG2525031.1 NAD(P)/FAD-dependent oxidoreductase [Stenotrophomonas sp. HITSZ_GD]
MTEHKRRIAIVGYGTAGQAMAVLLQRDGHEVEVFEQAAEPGPVGAGFLLQPSGLQVLWRMGLLDGVLAHGAPVHRLYGDLPGGRAVMEMAYRDLEPRLFGLGLQRGALFMLLRDAWESPRLHAGTRIVAVDAERGRVQAQDGRWHDGYDLVVAADGAASVLRDRVGTPRLDRPYPWGALWCLVPRGDWAHGDELRQRYQGARKMIGLLPVGTRPDDPQPRMSFFWSLPREDFARWREAGVAPWLEEIATLWPQARACLAGIHAPAQLATAAYRDAVAREWHWGRLVLAGDAAHAMSPQLGQGVNMALLDAWALCHALRVESSLARALPLYQRERQAHVSIYHFWSRWLTPLFQSERDVAARLRDVALRPLGRVPGGRGHMLRVLSGTQHGWVGQLALAPEFLAALAQRAPSAAAPAPA